MQHPFFAEKTYRLRHKTYRLRPVNLLFVMTKPIGWKTMDRVYITELTISLWENKNRLRKLFNNFQRRFIATIKGIIPSI